MVSENRCNRGFASFLLLLLCFDRYTIMGASFVTTTTTTAKRIPIKGYCSTRPTLDVRRLESTGYGSARNSCRRLSAENNCSNHHHPVECTDRLVTKSGLPLCRYALGGAARSTQPTSLVHDYCEVVRRRREKLGTTAAQAMAPFLFYYNPHRYPAFMKGVREVAAGGGVAGWAREDIFLASGGSEFSARALEQRLSDALEYSGGSYLDLFVLEYVCPGEVDDPEFMRALKQAREWVTDGRVRYVAASTHSHEVGAWLASLRMDGETDETFLDAMMLRYNMAHKVAAERISLPACAMAGIPVLAFTTTRWNRLQEGHPDWPPTTTTTSQNSNNNASADNDATDQIAPSRRPPTTPECLSFALASSLPPSSSSLGMPDTPWPVEIVLHSARTTDELNEAMECLSTSSPSGGTDPAIWREYGNLDWNNFDGFDEYPEEQNE